MKKEIFYNRLTQIDQIIEKIDNFSKKIKKDRIILIEFELSEQFSESFFGLFKSDYEIINSIKNGSLNSLNSLKSDLLDEKQMILESILNKKHQNDKKWWQIWKK